MSKKGKEETFVELSTSTLEKITKKYFVDRPGLFSVATYHDCRSKIVFSRDPKALKPLKTTPEDDEWIW